MENLRKQTIPFLLRTLICGLLLSCASVVIAQENAEFYYNLGVERIKQGRYTAAMVAFDRAIELKNDYAEAYSNRGVAKYKLRKYAEAKLDVEKALEINPNDVIARRQKLTLELHANTKIPDELELEPSGTVSPREEMPRFPGCEDMIGTNEEKKSCADKKMLEFIYKNLQYPEAARNGKIQGMVVISFMVYEDGSIGDAILARDIGAGCGDEGLRIVSLMEQMTECWTPGEFGNDVTAVRFNLPIRFRLE